MPCRLGVCGWGRLPKCDAYARLFIKNGGSLRELLTSSEQDLFRRAQVRQLLDYERATDRQRYLQDVGWLLSADEVVASR
jgi:hypothetical protein